jgi:hypothetical protein
LLLKRWSQKIPWRDFPRTLEAVVVATRHLFGHPVEVNKRESDRCFGIVLGAAAAAIPTWDVSRLRRRQSALLRYGQLAVVQ